MAMIPTMMARTPSRISEVDDDLSIDAGLGVDVDVDMNGAPFVWPGARPRLSPLGCAENGRRRDCATSIPGLAHLRNGANAYQAVSR
jgi:hypothetical protein